MCVHVCVRVCEREREGETFDVDKLTLRQCIFISPAV